MALTIFNAATGAERLRSIALMVAVMESELLL
jgi:hypothetical protein